MTTDSCLLITNKLLTILIQCNQQSDSQTWQLVAAFEKGVMKYLMSSIIREFGNNRVMDVIIGIDCDDGEIRRSSI